jgi:dephospho-CoA kinase
MTDYRPRMFHIALTGNVAAGKSTVAALFRDWGAVVLDADQLVREVQQPGTPVFDAIVQHFGPVVVSPDGTLDRAALRARVLADPAARRELERLVHPAVEGLRRARLAAHRGNAGSIVVSEIPLLFEALDPAGFDAVVLVDAAPVVRRARLERTRGLAPGEAEALLAAQLPAETKRARSTFVIDNDGDHDALRRDAWLVWRKLVSRARARA